MKNKRKDGYKLFKTKLDADTYFNQWEAERLVGLTEDLKVKIYHRYGVKCEVFKRDSFSCRNLNCTSPHSSITLHHIRFQKNGGQDSTGNCVTLCDSCHKAYHAATLDLKFPNDKGLPKKIRNQTIKLHVSDEVDWKAIKKQMRKFRKNLMPTLRALDDEDLYVVMRMFFDEMLK